MQSIDTSRVSPIAPEDVARAQWYGLIARLFTSPLSADELAQLAHAVQAGQANEASEATVGNVDLDLAFHALCKCAGETDVQAANDEFEALFGGTGKAEILLYASFHQAGFLHEKPLVDLRSRLNHLGIVRKADISETEDHLSLLCSVMQSLIVDRAPLSDQRDLFIDFLADWFESASEALARHPQARLYRYAGQLWKAFFSIERQSFDFEE